MTLPTSKYVNSIIFFPFPRSFVSWLWYQSGYRFSGMNWTLSPHKCERLSFVITLCLWSFCQFSVYVTMHIFYPIWINFASGNSWSSVSNALVKSIYITSTAFPSSINLVMWFKRVITFVWNDLSFIHPESSLLLLALLYSYILSVFLSLHMIHYIIRHRGYILIDDNYWEYFFFCFENIYNFQIITKM